MLRLLALALVLASVTAWAEEAEDDPKQAREGDAQAQAAPIGSEDDPKFERGAQGAQGTVSKGVRVERPVPRVKLAYRWLRAAGLEGPPIDFHVVELDYYPSSMRWFRFGMSAEGGIGKDAFGSWFFTAGALVGVQYPWRVTPFLDARFTAGVVGGSYLGQAAVSWIHTGGIEGGAEVHLGGRFYVSLALGWAHPTYSGIDVEAVRQNPMLAPKRKDFSNDTFTLKVGFGL